MKDNKNQSNFKKILKELKIKKKTLFIKQNKIIVKKSLFDNSN